MLRSMTPAIGFMLHFMLQHVVQHKMQHSGVAIVE
jgi:hypothetical protein